MAGLTPKQQRFVEEYLIDLNAAAAYRRAGYRAKNDHDASANASRLMAKDSIQQAIQAGQRECSERSQVDVDYVVAGLKREAKLVGEGSSPSARVRAYELLGKHIGMFVDRHEVTGELRLQIVEEIIDAPDPHQNGQAPPGPV